MRPLILLLLIIFAGGINSCSKKPPISNDLDYLIGDYDFVYSTNYSNEFTINTDLTDNYGIRITDKYKIIFFKNGAEIAKYKLVGEEQFEPYLNMSSVQIQYKYNAWYPFYFSGDTIMVRLDPMRNHDNYYLKK